MIESIIGNKWFVRVSSYKDWRRVYVVALSLALLGLCKLDLDRAGVVGFVVLFWLLLFYELWFLRCALANLYANAITNNKLLAMLLKGRLVNFFVTSVISFYMAVYFVLHIHLLNTVELLFYLAAGILFIQFFDPVKSLVSGYTKAEPTKVFSRFGVALAIAIIMMVVKGAWDFYHMPSFIVEQFDRQIPEYVSANYHHSFTWFQHLMRFFMYVDLNIQSIGMAHEGAVWLSIIRFLLLLSPAHFVTYVLLLLSILGISEKYISYRKELNHE